MRIGIDVAQHQLTWEQILQRVRWAEEAGFDGAWVFDHFKALYGNRNGPCLESWTLLAALAASTTRIRLGVEVTGVTYRHPSILAVEAVTVDHVSNGRLEIGIGAAWHEEEHRQLGIEFPEPLERLGRLEDAIQMMRALMTGVPRSFKGRHWRLENASYHPRPVQKPTPPIWVGGSGEKVMLGIVGRHADVWHAFGSVETLARKSAIVDKRAEEAGRDPASILRATDLSLSESWDQVRRRAEGLRRIGFGYVIASWPSEGAGRMTEFVNRVMPELEQM